MRTDRGFTLVEVLMITVILGILAGLAIQQYASLRERGYDSKVAAAVRGVATSQEAYYTEHRFYTSDFEELDHVPVGDVAIAILAGNSGNLASSFRIVGRHPAAARTFTWLSDPKPGEPNLIEN